jgi:hypothetical protein
MNILDKIEARFNETKSACKVYATVSGATKVAEREVAKLNAAHGVEIDCPYIITFVPSQKKYTVVFHLSVWLNCYGTGTLVTWFANRGFFSA